MKKILLVFATAQLSLFGHEVGLKNFREFYSTLQLVLDVDPASSPVIKETFNKVHQNLPAKGMYTEFNSGAHWGMFQLVAEFCGERINRDVELPPEKRWLHQKVDFSMVPQAQIKVINALLEDYSALFWARPLKENEKKLFTEHIANELSKGVDTPGSTKLILLGLCLSFGTASEFFIRH